MANYQNNAELHLFARSCALNKKDHIKLTTIYQELQQAFRVLQHVELQNR